MKLKTNPEKGRSRPDILKQIRLQPDTENHRAIRRLWIAHSTAEDKRDIPGLMATLTEDCVYTVLNTGTSWHGKQGATRFYEQLLASFPDIRFDLQHIVIGPQGVFEEAHVTATYEENWLDLPPAQGQSIEFDVTLFFPWEAKRKLFAGERITFSGIIAR
jgi:ketosteroid isomerase-like protein